MKRIVNLLRELRTDARHARQVLDAGAGDLAQAAEILEQRLAAFAADAGNPFDRLAGARSSPPRPVPGDGETVGLVADLLDQVQSGGGRGQYSGPA